MSRTFRMGFCLALVGLLSGTLGAAAEVKIAPSGTRAAASPQASGLNPALVPEGAVSLQCWQNGAMVYEAVGLGQAGVVPLLPAAAQAAANGNVGLKFRDQAGARITLLPLGEALCLIRGPVGKPG